MSSLPTYGRWESLLALDANLASFAKGARSSLENRRRLPRWGRGLLGLAEGVVASSGVLSNRIEGIPWCARRVAPRCERCFSPPRRSLRSGAGTRRRARGPRDSSRIPSSPSHGVLAKSESIPRFGQSVPRFGHGVPRFA